jgi:ComF family protein
MLKKHLNMLLEVLYPRSCAACGDTISGDEKHLCIACLFSIPKTDSHLSDIDLIDRKFWGKLDVKHTYSFLKFSKKGKVQNILHALKYKNKPELAEYLGKMYGSELKSINFNKNVDFIVGIPLHKDKLAIRGYNQADHFAVGLSAALDIPSHSDLMVRNTFTESQTKKANRFKRFQNIDGVFEIIDKEKVKNARIALVDDVLTTGATLEVAGQELINNGCKELYIITIAAAY